MIGIEVIMLIHNLEIMGILRTSNWRFVHSLFYIQSVTIHRQHYQLRTYNIVLNQD
ncbi:hypothetical protein [Limosilactobacillus reuteri]|uniref:hypothetical protein n=1 Tax=Limosilactobacillus reuteri TaxID=1598 RepID=UPI001E4BD263|nr:hypothetical protein [Limosilactobacillus reuteri]MCC4380667.1 hypothetical protein [Limosilactobacillus reuteri]